MKLFRIILFVMLAALLPAVVGAGFREQRLGVIPPEYKLESSNIVFTPDGSKVAFAARFGDKVRIIFGESAGKLYDHVRMISISSDGRYVVHNGTMYSKGKGKVSRRE